VCVGERQRERDRDKEREMRRRESDSEWMGRKWMGERTKDFKPPYLLIHVLLAFGGNSRDRICTRFLVVFPQ